jgi:glycosyltransferase involved in cell wall biosynthesis
MLAYCGGVRRLLGEGLPYLQRSKRLMIEYAELCRNKKDMNEMERAGVPVNRELGVRGSGVLSHHQGALRTLDLLKSAPRLGKLIWRMRRSVSKYDAIYVHEYREMLFVYAAGMISGVRTGPTVVWHCHGLGDGAPPPFLAFLANKCFKVIAVSQDTARRLKEIGVDSSRVRVIYNAVDPERIKAQAKQQVFPLPKKGPGHSVILLACATIRDFKGVHIAIMALEKLPLTCHLWITGDPNDPASKHYKHELDIMIAQKGLETRVHFIGHRRDIYYVMACSDVVVVPSLCCEAFGLVAVEAMTLEKPVIVSNRGGLPEAVGSEENGWIFDSGDPTALAMCVRTILAEPESATKRAANGKRRVDRLFRFERWADDVASILTQCIPGVSGTPI